MMLRYHIIGVKVRAVMAVLLLTLIISQAQGTSNKDTTTEETNNPIDVYYINLKRRPDRDANIQQEFHAAGIVPPLFQVHRFEAIDGLTHEMSPEEQTWFHKFDATVGRTSPHNTNLLKANSLSHMGVWQALANSGKAFGVVFQDDVQLSSANFVSQLQLILRHNPRKALITWIGCNGYAQGSVSRSAPLDPRTYNPDQISTAIPPANVIGKCRPGLIATNSLAYVLTRRGALELLHHFQTHGWDHHTDHALVDYLDKRGMSYISRTILATTHDDGFFGSDIFENSQQAQQHLDQCQALVQQALVLSSQRYSQKQAIAKGRTRTNDTNPYDNLQKVQCESYNCHFADCPVPVVTFVYLQFAGEEGCETTMDGTCKKDPSKYELDSSGVRRDKSRKKFRLNVPPAQVTLPEVVQNLPAFWVLQEWNSGDYDAPPAPWPLHAQGDVVEAHVDNLWMSAQVVAVGYKENGWPTHATYVVQLKGDKRLIPIVQVQQVRSTR